MMIVERDKAELFDLYVRLEPYAPPEVSLALWELINDTFAEV